MDDWQDAALTNRHLHNRVGKQGRGKGGKSNGAFDVHKIFGTYEVKCPASRKIRSEKEGQNAEVGRLEVYNLNELGNALVGELVLPGVLRGIVILAGSRKTMKVAIRAFEDDEREEEELEEHEKEEGAGDEEDGDDMEDEDEQSDEEDDREQQRHRQFEKNSFRSPKFWLKWQGEILSEASSGGIEQDLLDRDEVHNEETQDQTPASTKGRRRAQITDSGYLVFSGNNCDKFQGTLSCEVLGWSNVKVSGWKIKSQPARDFYVQWKS